MTLEHISGYAIVASGRSDGDFYAVMDEVPADIEDIRKYVPEEHKDRPLSVVYFEAMVTDTEVVFTIEPNQIGKAPLVD